MSKVIAVYQLLVDNQQFDQNMLSKLANASTEVPNAQSILAGAGFANAAAKVATSNTAALAALGTYIAGALPTIFDSMDIFSARMWIEDQIDSANAATWTANNISTAFGAILAGRTYVASLNDIANAASPTANAINLESRANSISMISNTALSLITAETDFFDDSAGMIDNYALANHIVTTFNDFSTKAVIGAVGSDALLTVLNPPTSSGPYEPPIDGAGSGEADPTPIR